MILNNNYKAVDSANIFPEDWVLGQTEDAQEIKEYFHLSLCGEVSIP